MRLSVFWAVSSVNTRFTEIRKRVFGDVPNSQHTGITATILEDMTIGGQIEYDYRVSFRAQLYDFPNEESFGATLSVSFNLEALEQAAYEANPFIAWPQTFNRAEDHQQIINATDTMEMYFALCMGLPFHENEDGSIASPPSYFPVLRPAG